MLSENLDWSAARKAYTENGWVVINNILKPECAEDIWNTLISDISWNIMYVRVPRGKPNIKMSRDFVTCTSEEFSGLTGTEKADIFGAILERAKRWYAYYYFNYELLDAQNKTLKEFYKSIGTEKYFGFIKYVTGELNINARSAGATCYRPGCFLKRHSDEAPENRRVAHVFGFTKGWEAHWGGLLHILNENDVVEHALMPGFNTLTLFKVPTEHFVSQVANYAPENRYSITGWFMEK